MSVGIGSGIGAIFKAPLGGAVLAAEILYRDDIEVETLLPAIIASIVSYAIFGAFEGFTPLFGYLARYQVHNPLELVWFALIGVVCGLVGLLYAKGFYGLSALFERLPVTRCVRPALGGLVVGLVALCIPQVLGTGYGWVQESLGRESLLHLSLAVVLLLPFAKILATGFSIGSGGSGGVFGPGIVIGAFVGASIWRLLEPFAPGLPHEPGAFVVVGDDGVLWIHLACAARSHPHGRRDDRFDRDRGPGDDRGGTRHLDRAALRRHHLPEPAPQSDGESRWCFVCIAIGADLPRIAGGWAETSVRSSVSHQPVEYLDGVVRYFDGENEPI